MRLRILVAPSGYKECLEADRVAAAIAAGVRRADPDALVTPLPLVDGGEGFARAMASATGGTTRTLSVTGPVGDPVTACFGLLGGDGPRTAVVEMAQAAGLRLVPAECRDPMHTTTRGVGELIRAALDEGATHILVGCGDSGTNDGGAGMAQALGIRLLDAHGVDIPPGCGGLAQLASIDMTGRDPRLADVAIEAVLNITTLLCGPRGVARVFGPQKGADPATIEQMAAALDNLAAVIEASFGIDVRAMPGGGASGGLGTGLSVFLGAELRSRYDVVLSYFDLDGHLDRADLVFTAEGGIDLQTPNGKIPVEVARRAKQRGLPVIALAGAVDDRARIVYDHGIDAFFSTSMHPGPMEMAMAEAETMLALGAENAMRAILAGRAMPRA
ncbi:MAG TPA: glycerate kinase [Sphingopyxis sp.]|jgi:glycerate kinase|uniref:glycerate kinase family protein n=1 Tax=Sphingopyxis sp. TaxID=1908224 RepID=UPI002E152632|nr:glycerate kinase [Sphingopyxis sp.]